MAQTAFVVIANEDSDVQEVRRLLQDVLICEGKVEVAEIDLANFRSMYERTRADIIEGATQERLARMVIEKLMPKGE
jgi:hypothetical protein